MKRKLAVLGIASVAALFSGPAAEAGPLCVLQKVCVGISIHCPAESGEPGCPCINEWVHGNHIYHCF